MESVQFCLPEQHWHFLILHITSEVKYLKEIWSNEDSYSKFEVKWEIWILLEKHGKKDTKWHAETALTTEKTFQQTTAIQYALIKRQLPFYTTFACASHPLGALTHPSIYQSSAGQNESVSSLI